MIGALLCGKCSSDQDKGFDRPENGRSGQLLKGDSFTQELPGTHSWGTYTGAQCMTGDRNDKEPLNRREQNPPSASELTNQAGQQLANYLAKQITGAIR